MSARFDARESTDADLGAAPGLRGTSSPESCSICGGRSTPVGALASLKLSRCLQCGFIFRPNVRSDDVRGVYEEPYFERYGGRGAYTEDEPARWHDARVRLKFVQQHLTGPRVLEIGCAAGYFLACARKAGLDVLGIEPSTELAREASDRFGVEVRNGFVEDVELPAASFDAVCGWHVLEHIPVPEPTLRHLRDTLRPGGLLLLEVPNVASLRARREGIRWRGFADPGHVAYYSPPTLATLLANAGFDIVEIETAAAAVYRPWPRSLLSRAKQLVVFRDWPSRYDPSKHELLRVVARPSRSASGGHGGGREALDDPVVR